MKKEKQISLSFIRVMAAACVVILHTCYMAVSLYGNFIKKAELTVSMCVTHLCMTAIPCFIMVTGALLLDPEREITIEKILKKYVFRVLMALILFSVVYKVFDIVMSGGTEQFSTAAVNEFFAELLSGSGWSHLWYLYMLMALYLLTPAIRCIIQVADDKIVRYLLVTGFVFMCILPLCRKLTGIQGAFYIDLATVYPVYYMAGYTIRKDGLNMRRYFPVLVLTGIAGIIIASVLRYCFGIEVFGYMLGYSSPFTFVASVGIFGLLSARETFKDPAAQIVRAIDPLTFGIYLTHVIFLRVILRYMKINPYTADILSVLSLLLIAALSFAVSMAVTALIKKIPGIRRVI